MDQTMSDSKDWVELRRDQETGIESINAHFSGHAYDAHDHDELLVGVTRQGLQRFHCRRASHTSTPGRVILIEPGAVHDGHAPEAAGFTYVMLYLPQPWVADMMQQRGQGNIARMGGAFRHTLTDDVQLARATEEAWYALHQREGRLARDQTLDQLMNLLSRHLEVRPDRPETAAQRQMLLLRDYLHDFMAQDIGLDELSRLAGLDRFRLTRQFRQAFGQSPHAYLVRLRLRAARALLAQGIAPVEVAARTGFADQSHLGRWFRRAWHMTPATYQRACTNLLYGAPPRQE